MSCGPMKYIGVYHNFKQLFRYQIYWGKKAYAKYYQLTIEIIFLETGAFGVVVEPR